MGRGGGGPAVTYDTSSGAIDKCDSTKSGDAGPARLPPWLVTPQGCGGVTGGTPATWLRGARDGDEIMEQRWNPEVPPVLFGTGESTQEAGRPEAGGAPMTRDEGRTTMPGTGTVVHPPARQWLLPPGRQSPENLEIGTSSSSTRSGVQWGQVLAGAAVPDKIDVRQVYRTRRPELSKQGNGKRDEADMKYYELIESDETLEHGTEPGIHGQGDHGGSPAMMVREEYDGGGRVGRLRANTHTRASTHNLDMAQNEFKHSQMRQPTPYTTDMEKTLSGNGEELRGPIEGGAADFGGPGPEAGGDEVPAGRPADSGVHGSEDGGGTCEKTR